MKRCTKCKEEKELTEFYKRKAAIDGHQYVCKDCVNGYNKENKQHIVEYGKSYHKVNKLSINKKGRYYYEKRKDGYYKVYHLPNYTDNSHLGYIGCTGIGITDRINEHRGLGRDVSNYYIVDKFTVYEEALLFEDSYHQQGYDGGLSVQERIKLNKYLQCQNIQTKKNKRS